MTDRVQNAIDVLDKATPGPWYHRGYNKILDEKGNSVALCAARLDIEEMVANKNLLAAAPDLATEVIRLRKWQSEAVVKLIAYASKLRTDLNPVFGKSYSDAGVRKEDEEYLADLDRLIAEAPED